MGVSVKTISRWETGENIPPDATLKRLARLMGEDGDRLVAAVHRGDKLPEVSGRQSIVVPFYAEGPVLVWSKEAGMQATEWIGKLVRWIEESPLALQSFVKASITEKFPAIERETPAAPPAGTGTPAPIKKAALTIKKKGDKK